jgi:hypothetical protein
MTLKQIYQAIKEDGEVKVNNIEIVWYEFGTEVSKDGEYQFTATNWHEVRDYLIENEIVKEVN